MTLSKAFGKLRARHTETPVKHPLPSSSDVEAVEADLGITLPSDLRHYLLEVSDVFVGTLEPVTLGRIESHTHLLNVIQSARAYGVPDELLPFCEDNADFFCFNNKGEIEYWSHNGATDERWPDMATWIEQVWLGGG